MYFGTNAQKGRTRTPQLYAMDLESQQVRELATGLDLIALDTWCPLSISRDGESIFVLRADGDMKRIISLPREGSGVARTLLSFPSTAAPLNLDVARDGSL